VLPGGDWCRASSAQAQVQGTTGGGRAAARFGWKPSAALEAIVKEARTRAASTEEPKAVDKESPQYNRYRKNST
jgi:hypothetical protein